MMRRTPMKRTPMKRAAPATKSHSNQAAALTSQALTAIKTRAPLRASTYAAPTEPAAPIAKAAPVRSEKYRRAVASLPCAACGIYGYSQHAHGNEGKGMGLKTDDRTGVPLCCARPGEEGCHTKFDQYRLLPGGREAHREAMRTWGAQTRVTLHSLGLWPKNLPHWPGESPTPSP